MLSPIEVSLLKIGDSLKLKLQSAAPGNHLEVDLHTFAVCPKCDRHIRAIIHKNRLEPHNADDQSQDLCDASLDFFHFGMETPLGKRELSTFDDFLAGKRAVYDERKRRFRLSREEKKRAEEKRDAERKAEKALLQASARPHTPGIFEPAVLDDGEALCPDCNVYFKVNRQLGSLQPHFSISGAPCYGNGRRFRWTNYRPFLEIAAIAAHAARGAASGSIPSVPRRQDREPRLKRPIRVYSAGLPDSNRSRH